MRTTVSQKSIIYWSVWGLLTILCLLLLGKLVPTPSDFGFTVLSLIVFVFVNIYPRDSQTNKVALLGLTHVHLLYASLSAFGLAWVYYFFGQSAAANVPSSVRNAIFNSPNYGKAIALSSLAFLFYTLAVRTSGRGRIRIKLSSRSENRLVTKLSETQEKTMSLILSWLGVAFVLAFLVMMLYMLLSGRMTLQMSYHAFMSSVSSSEYYSLFILLYSVGICYIIACANGPLRVFGLALYGVAAFLLLVTGNKGEVLYAVLACIGVTRRKGSKISLKLVLGIAALVFVLIPFITASRQGGVLLGLNNMSVSFIGFLTEVGAQLRCTTRLLDQFDSGTRSFIWGYSYYNPIINIIDRFVPFVNLRLTPPASFDFKVAFSSWGFNQIAEGYANFGAVGACLYFYLVGWFLSKREKIEDMSNSQLAYYGSICAEFINVSRNKFAFFWGHIFILTVIYLACKWLCSRKRG